GDRRRGARRADLHRRAVAPAGVGGGRARLPEHPSGDTHWKADDRGPAVVDELQRGGAGRPPPQEVGIEEADRGASQRPGLTRRTPWASRKNTRKSGT